MAKKRASGEVNVSEAIREYLKANAGVGPTAAAEAISAQIGKTISPTYVSNIKSNMNGKPKGKRRGRPGRPGRRPGSVASAPEAAAAPASRRGSGSVDMNTITAVKEAVERVGAATVKQLADLLG